MEKLKDKDVKNEVVYVGSDNVIHSLYDIQIKNTQIGQFIVLKGN
jgi:hypothetical protein